MTDTYNAPMFLPDQVSVPCGLFLVALTRTCRKIRSPALLELTLALLVADTYVGRGTQYNRLG